MDAAELGFLAAKELKRARQFEEESGEIALLLFCPQCHQREWLPVHLLIHSYSRVQNPKVTFLRQNGDELGAATFYQYNILE